MDSHLLVVSGVSSCWRSSRSEAEMNPEEAVAVERVASLLKRRLSQQRHTADNKISISYDNLQLHTSSRAESSFPTFRLPNTRPATPDPTKQVTQPQTTQKDIRLQLVTNIYKKKDISIAKRALLGNSRRRVGARPSVSYEFLRKVTAESTVFCDWT